MSCCGDTGSKSIHRWVLVGLNVISWVFSVVTLASCTFIKATYDGYIYSGEDQWGLFSWKYGGSCESYPNAKGAPYIQAGQAFGILQNLSLVFSMTGILSVILCLPANAAKWVWLVTKIMYCVALLWTLLIFVAFGDCTTEVGDSGIKCKPGAAGIINILNVLFVLGMAVLCWFVPVPSKPIIGCCAGNANPSPQKNQANIPKAVPSSGQPPSGGTVVTRTVENTPQGRKIIEEVTYPDGSKTITETLEQVVDNTMMDEEEDVVMPPPSHNVMKAPASPMSKSAPERMMAASSPKPVPAVPVYHPPADMKPPQQPSSYSPRRETDSHSSSPTRKSRSADPPGEAEYSRSIISTAL